MTLKQRLKKFVVWEYLLPLLVLIIILLLCFSKTLSTYVAVGSDTYVHLLKIQYLTGATRALQISLIDWYDLYFTGCFFLHNTYPPFYYYFAVLVNSILGDFFITYKTLTIFSVIIAGIGTYILTFRLSEKWSHRWTGSLVAAVAYSLSPFLLREIQLGEAPLVFAMGLAPFCVITLVELFRKTNPRNIGLFALSTGILFLTHQHILYFTLLAGLIYIFISFIVGKSFQKISALAGIGIGSSLFLCLISYWFLPLIMERYSFIALRYTSPAAAPGKNIVQPEYFLDRSIQWTGIYIGLSVFFLVIASIIVLRKDAIKEALTLLIVVAFSSYYALFTILPLSSLAAIPVRAFVVINLFSALIAGLGVTRILSFMPLKRLNVSRNARAWVSKHHFDIFVPFLCVIFILSLIIYDFTPAISYSQGKTYPSFEEARLHGSPEFISVIEFLTNQSGDGRVLVLPSSYGFAGSYGLFLPALINKTVFDGTGAISPIRIEDTYRMHYIAINFREADLEWLLTKIREYNIEYVVAHKTKTNATLIANLVETGEFTVPIDNSAYVVLQNKNPAGIVQVVGTKLGLIIGNYGYMRDTLHSIDGLQLVVGESLSVNEYTIEYLQKFDYIFCYDFYPDKEKLENYVKNGGTLIVDLDNTQIKDMAGVRTYTKNFSQDPKITINKLNVSISKLPLTGSPYPTWNAICYEGLDEVILQIDDAYNILGTKQLEQGTILFIGFNLYYYSELFESVETRNLLKTCIKRLIPATSVATTSLKSSFLKFTPQQKVIQIETTNDSYIFISLTYDPFHWKCYIDKKQAEVINCNSFYLLKAPKGNHTITLQISPSTIDYLSLTMSAFGLTVTMILIIFNKPRSIINIKRLAEKLKLRKAS